MLNVLIFDDTVHFWKEDTVSILKNKEKIRVEALGEYAMIEALLSIVEYNPQAHSPIKSDW